MSSYIRLSTLTSGKFSSGYVTLCHVSSGKFTLRQVIPGYVSLRQVRSGELRLGQVRSGYAVYMRKLQIISEYLRL